MLGPGLGELPALAGAGEEADLQVRDLAVDREGRWVAFVSKKPFASNNTVEIVFVDGQTKSVKPIRSGWGYDLKWVYPIASWFDE